MRFWEISDEKHYFSNPTFSVWLAPSITGQCKSPYGKIAIFVAVKFDVEVGNAPLYNVAQSTVECYAKRAGYEIIFVNLKDDNVTGNSCDKYSIEVIWWNLENSKILPKIQTFHFRRHCHLSHYMAARQDIKWWLFMDADVMIVNPNRCIHEFIDPGGFIDWLFDWLDFQTSTLPHTRDSGISKLLRVDYCTKILMSHVHFSTILPNMNFNHLKGHESLGVVSLEKILNKKLIVLLL